MPSKHNILLQGENHSRSPEHELSQRSGKMIESKSGSEEKKEQLLGGFRVFDTSRSERRRTRTERGSYREHRRPPLES